MSATAPLPRGQKDPASSLSFVPDTETAAELAGMATGAKQDAGNTSLAAVATAAGAPADTAATSDTGSFSLLAFFKRLLNSKLNISLTTFRDAILGSGNKTLSDVVAAIGTPAQAGGSVSVTNFPASQPVSISSMPSTPVTGAFYQAVQPVSGTVSVGNFPASQAVSLTSAPLPANAATNSGAANLAETQVNTSTTAATLVIARSTRRSVLFRNLDSAISVYIGPATVTASNGMLLKAGESVPYTFTGLLQVIAASGTPVVAVADEYD